MLERLLCRQEVVKSVLIHKFSRINAEQKSSLAKVYLNYECWDIIQALHDVLKPFELATRALSGKHYATLSLAYTTINILRFGLKPKYHDSIYVVLMKKSILARFELYFDMKMTKQKKDLMLVYSVVYYKKVTKIFSNMLYQFDSKDNNAGRIVK